MGVNAMSSFGKRIVIASLTRNLMELCAVTSCGDQVIAVIEPRSPCNRNDPGGDQGSDRSFSQEKSAAVQLEIRRVGNAVGD